MNVRLANSHVCMDAPLANSLFKENNLALLSFQESSKQLLVAPITSSWFKKMHEAKQCLLKDKNIQGDKSIALHALLIDYDLDETDRELGYELNEQAGWIKINLNN